MAEKLLVRVVVLVEVVLVLAVHVLAPTGVLMEEMRHCEILLTMSCNVSDDGPPRPCYPQTLEIAVTSWQHWVVTRIGARI